MTFLYQQGTMEAYTILMDFQIGTRIGELVVLGKKDMLDNVMKPIFNYNQNYVGGCCTHVFQATKNR